MGILESFFGVGGNEERSDGLSFEDIFGIGLDLAGIKSTSGEVVSEDTAMGVSTVYACVRIISEAIATLPLKAGQLDSDGICQPIARPPAFLSFTNGPFTQIDVLGQAMVSLLLWGNAYLATYRDALGRVLWLEVLDPKKVQPERIGADIFYRVEGSTELLTPLDILQIRGMTMPGQIEGMSVLSVARETLGLSIAATKFGASFFGNNAIPAAVIEAEGEMSPTGRKALLRNWNDLHKGAGNANKLAVLTQGAKLVKLSIPPDDAQFLQTRQFQVNDATRFFGVPTSKLAHTDGPEMGKTVEDKSTEFATDALRPWTVRLETGFTWLMHSEGRPRKQFTTLDLQGLMRGSLSNQISLGLQMVTAGAITINEFRADTLGKSPVAWGDEPISVQVQDDPAGDGPPEGDIDDVEDD